MRVAAHRSSPRDSTISVASPQQHTVCGAATAGTGGHDQVAIISAHTNPAGSRAMVVTTTFLSTCARRMSVVATQPLLSVPRSSDNIRSASRGCPTLGLPRSSDPFAVCTIRVRATMSRLDLGAAPLSRRGRA